MKKYITSIAASDSKTILHIVLYVPDHEIKGIVHILHGMSEHMGRYKNFAEFFTNKNLAVIGHDMIGHGKTKSYGKKDTYLEDWHDAVNDIEAVRQYIENKYPDLPIYQVGIGAGAYFGMVHQSLFPERYYKKIYVGVGRKSFIILKLVKLYIKLTIPTFKRQKPNTFNKVVNYYDKYFSEEEPFSWRYRSTICRIQYLNDPMINHETTATALLELLNVIEIAYKAELDKILTPLMLITGEEDQEEHFGKDTIRLNQIYRDAQAPVTLKIIPGYRHDILHDACAASVFDDIYRFILGYLPYCL